MEHGRHSGMWVPDEPPTWGRMFLPHLEASSVLAVLSLVALVVYLAAVMRLRRTGVSWPWWRTVAWIAGTGSLFAVTGTWLNGYSMVLFSVHMTQHMVLSLITPLLLLVAAPVTLALRTLPRGQGVSGVPRALLLNGLHSRLARLLAHPLFSIPLFLASLYGVYLPVPFHAFFGVAIMMASSLVVDTFAQPPAGWGIDPLRDQGEAGGIVWAFGELPTVLVLAVVFFSWASSDERRGKALDRAADRTGDAELAEYNARLRAMAYLNR